MRRPRMRIHARAALAPLALATAFSVAACGTTPITPVRLEGAIATTFANLVQVQFSWMDLAPMASSMTRRVTIT